MKFNQNEMNLLLVATNFCREDEERTPYGISCLVNAFINGKSGKHGKIKTFTYDLMEHFNPKLNKFDIDYNEIAKKLAKAILSSGCNIVGFSNFAWSDLIYKKTIKILSRSKNRPTIIMGGPMVCGGEQVLLKEYPNVDFFIESYGEKVFSNLGEYLSRAIANGNRLIKDLPVFETLTSPYLSGLISVKEGMSVRMELRRGCLFNCTFCRHRNPEKKVFCIGCAESHRKELELFKEKKVGKINVLDPYFNDCRVDFKEVSFNFLRTVKELKIQSPISLQIRPEMLNKEYLDVAESMPNLIFEIGIQSLDNVVSKKINRGGKNTREIVLEKLNEVIKRKIQTEITLIYGLPLQTAYSFKSDIETLKSLGFSKISAFPLQIYRGTDIFENYANFGLKVKLNDIGILQVYDTPNHDFSEMENIANELKN